MAGLLDIFNPGFYGGTMGGLLANLPAYQTQIGQGGFDGAPTDLSGQARAPMQVAPQMPEQPMQAPAAPQMGFLDRLGAGLGANSNTLLAMGASLLGGKGFGGAAEAAMAGRDMDRKQADASMTERALLARGLSPDVAKVAARNPALLTAVLSQQLGLSGQTDDIKEYQFAKSQGFTGSLEQWMQRKRAGAGEYGLQGIWGVGPDGKPALVQLGKSGEAIQSKLPEGFTPAKDPIKVDAGTHFVLLDPQTRQPIAQVAKNIAEAAAQGKEGEAQGAARVALPAAETTNSRAMRMLDELERHPGLGDAVGFIAGRLPALTPKAADARERIEQLDAMIFGDAVEVMRGLGALTDKEGPKVTAARARLKTAKSEEDYRTALKDVREIFQTGIENMRKKAGKGAAASPAAPAADPLGVR